MAFLGFARIVSRHAWCLLRQRIVQQSEVIFPVCRIVRCRSRGHRAWESPSGLDVMRVLVPYARQRYPTMSGNMMRGRNQGILSGSDGRREPHRSNQRIVEQCATRERKELCPDAVKRQDTVLVMVCALWPFPRPSPSSAAPARCPHPAVGVRWPVSPVRVATLPGRCRTRMVRRLTS